MVQTIISCVLLLLGLYLSLLNTGTALMALAGKLDRNVSAIPLVGGLLAAFGCAISPWPVVKAAWWVPLILDYGSVPLLLSTVIFVAGQLIKPSQTPTQEADAGPPPSSNKEGT